MCKPKNKKQHTHLTAKDCNREDILTLINQVYRKVHGLSKKCTPFTRGDYVLTHFDDDGDGEISSSEFSTRMNVVRSSSSSSSSSTRSSNQNSAAQNTQVISIATKLERATKLINTSRNQLLDTFDGDLIWNSFCARFDHFCMVFEALGHERHVHHRFIELSEILTTSFPLTSLHSRVGLRCLTAMRNVLEKDAAIILQSWWRRQGKGNGRSSIGQDSWSTTLRDMMETKRMAHRLRTNQLIKERKLNKYRKEKEDATNKMQALFRGKISRSKNATAVAVKKQRIQDEAAVIIVPESAVDLEDVADADEDVFDRHRRMEKKRTLILKGRKKRCQEHLLDPFIVRFMRRSSPRPTMPLLSKNDLLLMFAGTKGVSAENNIDHHEDDEQGEELLTPPSINQLLPSVASSMDLSMDLPMDLSMDSSKEEQLLRPMRPKSSPLQHNNNKRFHRHSSSRSNNNKRPESASQKKMKSIQNIFTKPMLSARRARIQRG